ncbi:protein ANKUB1-like [Pristis pectinata]|uniref:protein ANKUB1-like n=1 Tax=Pristis pectinata TaxID=685728 RepID=UPI00223CBD2B|nr:protein ANKUB1-like [Pristis pectinata]
MRIFFTFEKVCKPLDILQEQTVLSVKLMIKQYFRISLTNDNQGHRFLQLIYAGAVLEDDWVLADVGMTSYSTVKCLLKEEEKPILYVFNALTRQTIPIIEKPQFLTATVSELKSLVSLRSGLPVSTFRLSTQKGTELYNCNKIDDYKLEIGSTLRLDIWDGWKEYLTGCLLGHKHIVQHYLSEEEPVAKFQQRVALHMAAFFGHLDLAGWLLQQGVRADRPVGIHPYREWCQEIEHPDVNKCPVHAGAEAGQLLVLKVLVNNNVLCLDCRNPQGHDPLKICIQHRHLACALYLIAKAWSVVSFQGLSFPIRIYIKIKQWLHKVKRCVRARKRMTYKTCVGDTIVVDGFTEVKMSSRPKVRRGRKDSKGKVATLPALSTQVPSKRLKPPPLNTKQQDKGLMDLNLPAIGSQRKGTAPVAPKAKSNLEKERVNMPLPAIIRDTNPRPKFFYSTPNAAGLLTSSLLSFSEHNGRTTRQNAIYCLALASSFKEKPWLQQLRMARNLARRTIRRPVC